MFGLLFWSQKSRSWHLPNPVTFPFVACLFRAKNINESLKEQTPASMDLSLLLYSARPSRRLRRPSLQHRTLPLLNPRQPRELLSHHSRDDARSLASSCRRPHALLPGPAPSTAARAMPRAHCRTRPCRVQASCSRRLPLQIKTMRIVCSDSLAADNTCCSPKAAFVLLSRYFPAETV